MENLTIYVINNAQVLRTYSKFDVMYALSD